jgi:hypothetical protein
MPVLLWIKRNKLSAFLLAVIVLFVFAGVSSSVKKSRSFTMSNGLSEQATLDYAPVASDGMMVSKSRANVMPSAGGGIEPQPQISNRMVIRESNLSLLVKDVAKARDDIIAKAKEFGGYMVTSQTSNPGETKSATVVVRVTGDKLTTMLETLRGMAVKVVSEELSGTDVTDQYVDVEKRIAILEKTMAKFVSILDQAKEISDITNLNQQIIYIQDQIDSLKGSQMALAKNAELARVTIYLSTDEIALPYAPDSTWRPNVIFKLAVRGLVTDLRWFGEMGIWVAVYAVIWLPIVIAIYFIRKFVKNRMK